MVGDGSALSTAAFANADQPVLALVFAVTCFVALVPTQHLPLVPSLRVAPTVTARIMAVSLVAIPAGVLVGAWEGTFTQSAASLALLIITRWLVYAAIRGLRRRGFLVKSALLVGGEGLSTDTVSRLLREHPEAGLRPIVAVGPHVADVLRPSSVIVTSPVGPGTETRQALRRVLVGGASVYLAPSLAEVPGLPAPRAERLNGVVLGRLPRYPMHRLSWRIKRVLDLGVAVVVVTVLSPILLAVAVGVKLSSSGPVLFRQERVGRFGSRFTMFKFRTYPVDHVDDKFAREHDECPLWFGRLLRRTSIDELPQLFNVLKGEMSILGPRPERPRFAELFAKQIAEYDDRHRVPGGITGAAQVRGLWGNCSMEERVQVDNRYIDDWSLWHDFVILLRTPLAAVRKGRSKELPHDLVEDPPQAPAALSAQAQAALPVQAQVSSASR